ncbi:hypothetical protein B0T16DRAFT_101774 [Cercophora newfieldiana]|uniref:Uncharacterized protein n=1 Tax=Cercophora newfieldiana TaxID=92897 RepID=A0AA40CX64_9PEZI|nr:hypothetical protein B0T16DRAFT_101774 [Cercophora newfieldiana]
MFTLRASVYALLLAAASLVSASPDATTDLLARQAPGTPQFECHSDCGNAIAGGRLEGHCTNATWTGFYEECLGCALEFDIWKHYGNGLTGAAAQCGLTPTPSPAPAATSGSAAAPSGSASGTSTPTPTAPPASGSAATTGAASTSTSTAGAPGFATAAPLFAGMLMFAAAL